MSTSKDRAWEALGIGPRWALRERPAPESQSARLPPDFERADVSQASPGSEASGASPGPEVSGISTGSAASPVSLVERMDWPALREAVAGCRLCGLCESRRNTVFGVGDEAASWMVVGEAPGADEDRLGEPFVGRAGQLLDAMLAAVGRSRRQGVFIANVLKCRPPDNRNPSPEEIERCSPYLRRQVELVAPDLILVVGKIAAQALLDTEASIASLRGRVHRYRAGDAEIPVVVTYHPAYLLRTPLDKAKAWADLRLAARISASARR